VSSTSLVEWGTVRCGCARAYYVYVGFGLALIESDKDAKHLQEGTPTMIYLYFQPFVIC
jgi:hypothetical protein